jgi:antirestriction protein ArdC
MTTKPRTAASGTDALSRSDRYSHITGKITADLEGGVRPWHRPWSATNMEGCITRPLRHNGVPYQGINVVVLWMAAVSNGYASPHWFTFRQAQKIGGHVRKSERGELVVYADRIIRTATDEAGAETDRAIPFLKGYTVFNAEQCEKLPAHYVTRIGAPLPIARRIETAHRFFAATGAAIRHGGNRAYYAEGGILCRCRPSNVSAMPKAIASKGFR